MNFLLQLRTAAQNCSDKRYQRLLRKAADDLDGWIITFQECPSTETMIGLNSAWAYANRLYSNLPPEGNPAPLSGNPEPARLAA